MTSKYRSPSNIALVKYWGKHGVQLPANPSISFTLSNSHTETSLSLEEGSGLDFRFEGEPRPDFHPKLETFFERIGGMFPFLAGKKIIIDSTNSFPHSSGIASSASAMSALAMCLVDIESQLTGASQESLQSKASEAARLGSGSACRSVFGGFTLWGMCEHLSAGNDNYAVPLNDIHPDFLQLQDTILLVDKGAKEVSSTVGHGLMNGHPFAQSRFEQAKSNIARLLEVLKTGDFHRLADIMEQEALSLHAMMMTSLTPYILFRPATIEVITRIMQRRKQGHDISFTLDAGANVHMVYPKTYEAQAMDFLKSELLDFCADAAYICDEVGTGPQKLDAIS